MKISRCLLVSAAWLAMLPAAALAQFETATVLGTVKDGTGAVIVGSKVILENVKTGVISTGQSNDAGNFDFVAEQIGFFRCAVCDCIATRIASGFSKYGSIASSWSKLLRIGSPRRFRSIKPRTAAFADDASRGQFSLVSNQRGSSRPADCVI